MNEPITIDRSLLSAAYNLIVSIHDSGRVPEQAIIAPWIAAAEKVLYPSLSALDELV